MLKKLIIAFKMCFSMFTIFSFPNNDWDEDSRKYMLAFLPFVGLYIGLLWILLCILLFKIKLSKLYYINPFLISLFPVVATGFIHFDGFMDVCDSISCFANREKRIAILKDSRVGAFGVIYAVIYFIFGYIVVFSMQKENLIFNNEFSFGFSKEIFFVLLLIPFFSRILSSYFINALNKIEISEYNKVNKSLALYYVILLLIGLVVAYFVNAKLLIVVAVEILIDSFCFLMCNKIYKGVNGDVCGFALTISESVALFTALLVL